MNFSGSNIIAVIFIAIGISALLGIDLGKLIVPAFMIFIGIRLLSRQSQPDQPQWLRQEETKENQLDQTSIFDGVEKRVKTNDFKGGKVNLLFGGGTLDLREAKISEEDTIQLEVNAIFGGIKILVPPTWSVSSSVVGVIGGFANNTQIPDKKKEAGRLYLKGAAIFGGGEVVN